MTEKQIEEILMSFFENEAGADDAEYFPSVDSVRSFKGTICTTDKGVVIDFKDGSQVLLTIQGYTPSGRRMD